MAINKETHTGRSVILPKDIDIKMTKEASKYKRTFSKEIVYGYEQYLRLKREGKINEMEYTKEQSI